MSALLIDKFSRCLCKINVHCGLLFRRHRFRKKRVFNRNPESPENLAARHFDQFYRPVYSHLWPSIRISLLSSQKYSLVWNNFSTATAFDREQLFNKYDLVDIMHLAKLTNIRQYAKKFRIPDLANTEASSLQTCSTDDNLAIASESTGLSDIHDLYNFVPATRVYSQREKDQFEEIQQSTFEPRNIEVPIVPDTNFEISDSLRIGVHEPGVISNFSKPRSDSRGTLPYYLMDAASVLPVVAMGIERDDKVLDLCAAPGGKSFVILQSQLTDRLTCNDSSFSRLRRFHDILRSYLHSFPSTVTVTNKQGAAYHKPLFNKVLVDVPCNTDRHMLREEEDNLFKRSRFKERMEIPDLQKNLLIAAIKSCIPGGTVVYSTCTLAPAQNDGTIQAAIEEIWNTGEIEVAVIDTSWIAEKFRKTFTFYRHCRFGQLVLPNLLNNFGPMYFCKIKRLK